MISASFTPSTESWFNALRIAVTSGRFPACLVKSDRLSGIDGVQRQQLDRLQAILRLVESVSCFRLVYGICGDRGRIIRDSIMLTQKGASFPEEVLLQRFVQTNVHEQVMIDVLGYAEPVWQRMIELPGLNSRKGLSVGRQQIPR